MDGLHPGLEFDAVQMLGRKRAGCARNGAGIAGGSDNNDADITIGSDTNSVADAEFPSRVFQHGFERIAFSAQGATPWLGGSSYGATNRRLLVVEPAPSWPLPAMPASSRQGSTTSVPRRSIAV
jgi:hypothetical protein